MSGATFAVITYESERELREWGQRREWGRRPSCGFWIKVVWRGGGVDDE